MWIPDGRKVAGEFPASDVLGQGLVQHDGDDGRGKQAGNGHGVEDARQVLDRGGDQVETESEGERNGDDHHVPAVHGDASQHVEAGGGHHAEHHDDAATEDGERHGGDHRADLRQETADDEDDGADRDHVPAHDSGHADDADVLAEGRVGKAAEDGSHRGSEAVGVGRPGNLLVGRVAVGARLRRGGGVADGLHGRDDTDQRHRDDGANAELQPVGEDVGDGDDARLGHRGEAHHAEVIRDSWYRTGDLARLDRDGHVFIVGRVQRRN